MLKHVFFYSLLLLVLAGCVSAPPHPPRRSTMPPPRKAEVVRPAPRSSSRVITAARLDRITLPSELDALGQKDAITWNDIDRITGYCSGAYGIKKNYLYAIMKTCSDFNLRFRSSAGAEGLMSLMPATARSLGVSNSYNAAQNIAGGALYFRQMLEMFHGDANLALAAYHAGPGRVRQHGGIPFKETVEFIRLVYEYGKVYESIPPWEAEKTKQQRQPPAKQVYLAAQHVPNKKTDTFHQGRPKGECSQSDIRAMVRYYASTYGLDDALVMAVISVESGFNPRAESPKGAKGLMQLMPGTARGLGVTDVFDPQQNIAGGTLYLAQLNHRFGGDKKLVLAAYNAGPGNVQKYGGIPPFRETQRYVNAVLSAQKWYQSQ
jgi:soluble lytic murein transglycosylase-like protein